jgi:hypothetical protein
LDFEIFRIQRSFPPEEVNDALEVILAAASFFSKSEEPQPKEVNLDKLTIFMSSTFGMAGLIVIAAFVICVRLAFKNRLKKISHLDQSGEQKLVSIQKDYLEE